MSSSPSADRATTRFQDPWTFRMRPEGRVAAMVRPSLEALLSIRPGMDPEPCIGFWKRLTRDVGTRLSHVLDNREDVDVAREVADADHEQIDEAFRAACEGPKTHRRVSWSSLTLQNGADATQPPETSATCAFGWITEADEPRGVSLRITLPLDASWERLAATARELAAGWPGTWRWIGVGYRFVTAHGNAHAIQDGHEVIYGRCRRFLGVDIGDTLGLYTSYWQDWLRTAAWLNLVQADLCQRLELTPAELIESAELTKVVDQGAYLDVVAGDAPVIGDVNARESVAVLREADRLLRAVRAPGGFPLIAPWNEETTTAWLNRFAVDEPFAEVDWEILLP